MSFEPSPQGAALLDKVEPFIRDVVNLEEARLAAVLEQNPDGLDPQGRKLDEVVAARNRIFRESAKAGFLTAHLPLQAGGGGLTHVDVFHLREAVFRHGLGFNQYVVSMTSRGPNLMLLEVQDSVRHKYQNAVFSGEKTTCFALTEYGAGSDAHAIETTAVRDGDAWIIDGIKVYSGNGPYADFAQVAARTSPAQRRGHGVTLFAVDLDSPGVARKMLRTLVSSGDWCEIRLDGVRVPAENVIGQVDEGLSLLMRWLEGERIDMCGQCLGLARYLLDRAITYAKERETFGAPIGSRQYVQGMIVDSEMEVYAARYAALATAEQKDRGARVRKESSMSKVLATQALLNAADRTVQVHGAHGLNKAWGIEKVFRLARSMTVYEGTSEINKITVARELGLPT